MSENGVSGDGTSLGNNQETYTTTKKTVITNKNEIKVINSTAKNKVSSVIDIALKSLDKFNH